VDDDESDAVLFVGVSDNGVGGNEEDDDEDDV
jgi:hypothetical protein